MSSTFFIAFYFAKKFMHMMFETLRRFQKIESIEYFVQLLKNEVMFFEFSALPWVSNYFPPPVVSGRFVGHVPQCMKMSFTKIFFGQVNPVLINISYFVFP